MPLAFELDLATPEELLLLQELDTNLLLQESLHENATRASAAAAGAHDWVMPHNPRLHMQVPDAGPNSAGCCSSDNSSCLVDDKQQDLQVPPGATHTAAAAAAAAEAAGMGDDLSSACQEGSAGLSSVSHLKGNNGAYGLQCCNGEAADAAAAAAAAASAAECAVSPDDEVLYLFKRVFSMPQFPGE
jgi:hypothetical protein